MIEIHYQAFPKYLLAVMNGPWTVDGATQALEATRAEADRQGHKRVLLDLRGLSKPDSEFVRFYSGRYLAGAFPPPFKVAAFAKPEAINKFGETAAVNRGAHFQIFPEECVAILWLMEGSNTDEINTMTNVKV